MYLERLLQLNMATLVALGTLLLSLGQRDPWLPLLVLIAAVGSVWLTDITGWFRLNRTVANVAAVVAVVVSLREVWYFSGGSQILGIAHMLVYVQIIVLFQEKDGRSYWVLVMLSLLQVVVAAALSQGVWFGLLLVVYMLVGLSAMALLFLYGQWSQYRSASTVPPRPAAVGGRWPLGGQESALTGAPSGRARAGVVRELFARLAMMQFGSLVLTLLLFFLVPRFGQTAWRGAVIGPKHVVGFSDTVTLGELGEIIESREEVMRVELTDASTGRRYPVLGEPYLRGAVLTHYEHSLWEDRSKPKKGTGVLFRDGRSKHVDGLPGKIPPSLLSPDPTEGDHLVLQRITVEPLDRDELFCIWPFGVLKDKPSPNLQFRRGRLLRPPELRWRRFTYELGTTAFVDGVQVALVPCDHPVDVRPLRQLPELPQLTKLAARWIADAGLLDEERFAKARALERQFHNSKNGFQYSLQGQERDESIDPVEDFIANNRVGHCEYFATALALMLRSQGIPSRVVVGYKCGEFNSLSQRYHVRQLHAHTWVEAYLEREHIPAGLLQDETASRWDNGGWLRLEPTAGAWTMEMQGAGAGVSFVGQVERRFRRIQSLWADYVMEMDRRRQRKAIYEPVASAIRHLREPDWWRGVLGKIDRLLDTIPWGGAGRGWLWAALAVLLALATRRFGPRWLGRLAQLCRRLAGRDALAAGGDRGKVEFYRRLEVLLARQGLVRSAGQTQREFAVAAGCKLGCKLAGATGPFGGVSSGSPADGRARLASLPGQVVDAFYHVRFGCLPLDSPQAQAIEHALRELEEAGAKNEL